MKTTNPSPMEIWGGVECTLSRVGERYLDQLEFSGHSRRPGDLDLFARLGIAALRYPVLWERTRPDPAAPGAWSWPEERLGQLRQLGIRPIVGLVHHGGGPPHTSLVDPSFADGLAAFAQEVAQRFPWVEDYTPVNEPLTTARFSGLYGVWHPHGRDALTFLRALLTQCRAVVLAMRAIRQVNSSARLVQTEDLGKVFSTPALAYQADFENERRWLSFDLLAGRVDRTHPLAHYLRWAGVDERELAWFLDNPCPPDLLGINYYVTSERFLDDRLEHYPASLHGGNGKQGYADVEAVRVRAEGLAGIGTMLSEAWQRYRRPLAITEVHLGCSREEQLRWFAEVWQAAQQARLQGIDLRAVTAWSLLGAYDWDSLATRTDGRYETGVFDLRSSTGPRPTALAHLVSKLAAGQQPDHPVLAAPGWWQRPERLLYPPYATSGNGATNVLKRQATLPLLVTGATGRLGQAFGFLCRQRGLPTCLLSHGELDIADAYAVERALDGCRPWAVINAAGYAHIDAAEREPEQCRRANVAGPVLLAQACARRGIALLTFSADLVFDGQHDVPYEESDRVAPLSVYGRCKAEAERRVLEILPTALVVRSSAFFGPWDARNFVTRALGALHAGQPFAAAEDMLVSPTYLPDLVHACLDLLIDREHGVWHLANRGVVSWAEFARQAATLAALDPAGIVGCSAAALALAAPRPRFSALGSERGLLLPPVDAALEHYVHHCHPQIIGYHGNEEDRPCNWMKT